MGRLGLEVWVRTSFQSFALVDRGNVMSQVGRAFSGGGNCPGEMPGRKCPTLVQRLFRVCSLNLTIIL